MNLKDAFAGISAAREEAGAQEPKPLSTQAPKHPGAQAPKRLSTQAPKHLPLQKTGKSSHPEYEAVKIYIRKQTRKEAFRKWEDAGDGDFSDLIQHLLEQYVGA